MVSLWASDSMNHECSSTLTDSGKRKKKEKELYKWKKKEIFRTLFNMFKFIFSLRNDLYA